MQILYLENGHPFVLLANTEDNPAQEWVLCFIKAENTVGLVKKELVVNYPYGGIPTSILSNQLKQKASEFVIGTK